MHMQSNNQHTRLFLHPGVFCMSATEVCLCSGHILASMKRRWGQQSSLAPLAAGMSNLSIESSECSVWTEDEVNSSGSV